MGKTKQVKCPKWNCHSINCVPLTEKKKFGLGKGLLGGAVGAVALGAPGVIIGGLTGLNGKKKIKMMCQDCGTIFEIKV